MENIIAFTDGSAVIRGENRGKGGFGVYIPAHSFGEARFLSKGFRLTKTGRVEIMALLCAIHTFPTKYVCPVSLTVYSDSEYVVKTFSENRLAKWIRDNWMGYAGPIANRDLWERVLVALNKRNYITLNLVHINGHQVDKEKDRAKKMLLLQDPIIRGNYIADKLADYKRHKIYHEDLESL